MTNFSFRISYNTDNSTLTKIGRQNITQTGHTNSLTVRHGNTNYGLDWSNRIPENYSWVEYTNRIKTAVTNSFGLHTQTEYDNLAAQNGTYITDLTTKKTYRIDLTQTKISNSFNVKSFNQPSVYSAFASAFSGDYNDNSFYVSYSSPAYNINLVEVETETYSVSIPVNRFHVGKAPYDMFAIPFSDTLQMKRDGVNSAIASKELAMRVANALSVKYTGAGFIYDIQLLPYCPVRYCIQPDGSFDAIGDNATYGMFPIKDNANATVGNVYVASSDSDTFNISLQNPIVITNPKIQSECDMYRLCSPNYNGIFEFNAAKNNGVSYFNVDFTYKPYNPYIHLNPDFGGLYGQDFNDANGLICGGDFSLPQTTSE